MNEKTRPIDVEAKADAPQGAGEVAPRKYASLPADYVDAPASAPQGADAFARPAQEEERDLASAAAAYGIACEEADPETGCSEALDEAWLRLSAAACAYSKTLYNHLEKTIRQDSGQDNDVPQDCDCATRRCSVSASTWKIRLSFVTPEGNYVDITGPNRGKRASYDAVPGALLLMIASHGHGDYALLDRERRKAMEACLDVLWPEWRANLLTTGDEPGTEVGDVG